MSNDYSIPPERPTNLVIQPYVNDLEIQNDFSRSNSLHLPASRPNRREVYLRELETHPPPSGGRYRECSPEFYRCVFNCRSHKFLIFRPVRKFGGNPTPAPLINQKKIPT